MMKGVIIGVICCITLLPAMILNFEKIIDKTTHKSFIPDLDKISHFITKNNAIWAVLFAALVIPSLYGNNNAEHAGF